MNKLTEKEIALGYHLCPICGTKWYSVDKGIGIKGTEEYCWEH